MTATVGAAADLAVPGDAVLAWLSGVLAGVGGVVDATGPVEDGIRVDRISLLERIKGAVAAAQCAEIVRFARSQVAAQKQAGVDYRRLGRGIGDQVGLATKTGGWHGARRLTLARDLTQELPATFELLARGDISEYVAQLVAAETSHLDGDTRRRVDAQLVDAGLAEMTPKQAAGQARRLACTADPEAATERARNARKDRRVSLRPVPDTMTWFGALLPVEQGVACLAALRRHADTLTAAGDGRTRAQIMADTAVERLTGQAQADDVPVEVNLVMPIDSLLDPQHPEPADLPGHGPIPAGLAHQIIATGHGPRWWRRLFIAPTGWDGQYAIIGGDRKARRFTGALATLIRLRDQGGCREPYCGAPIRHYDHIVPYRAGGPTSYTNGRGVCERHNYAREMPGWSVELLADHPHIVITTTPTGHNYLSQAPNPP
jgi:hypothetical protein